MYRSPLAVAGRSQRLAATVHEQARVSERITRAIIIFQRLRPLETLSLDIPTLETAHLLLRGFRAADFDAYAALVGDPDVTHFLGDGRALGRDDAWRQMAMFAGHWTLRGFGVWAVEERATGAFVGRIGCFEPEGWPAFEIAYTLSPTVWGRGYAVEGARAALRYAHDVLGRRGVTSVIRPQNVRSIRVAERLGARFDRAVPFFGGEAHLYVYPDPPDSHPHALQVQP